VPKVLLAEVGLQDLLAQMVLTQQLQLLSYLCVTDLMQEQLRMKSAKLV
jgi:hypothetical protein